MSNYLSPLIDREIFFGNPEISGAQISPDGKYISFIKPWKDILNIWVVPKDKTFDKALPVSNDQSRPIRSYFWSRDSSYILYVQDNGGDENYRVYAVDPAKASKENLLEPTDLTPFEDIRAIIVDLPRKNPDLIYVGINDRDKAWHDFYSINLSTGERSLLLKNTENFNSVVFDNDGRLRLTSRALSDGGNEILVKTNDGFKKILNSNLEETLNPIRFHKNNSKVYCLSNVGDNDHIGLYLYDLEKNQMDLIEVDPEGKVDLENVFFSDINGKLLATIYIGDKKRTYWKSESFSKDFEFIQNQFPNSEIEITSITKDENIWTVFVTEDIDPGSAFLFNRTNRSLKFLYRPRPELKKEDLSTMQPVSYESTDGLIIPAYLSLPNLADPTNLPSVLLVHGGPWARDYWGYNGFAQFLANRGYAVLQINFRGSTGYGKKFLNAAINEWGEKMQDDLSAGARFLIENKYADKDKIAIMGGSYGGYATLAGLTFTPDIYAAGVSIVGPSNLFTLLETIPPYWESARIMFHKRMGNPNTEAGKAQLKRQSPFFHARNIKAPLMVAQGANDPRVKKSESDQIVIAMRDLKLDVEYLNFPDEGHGFVNPQNNMAFIASMEKFLAKHINGRYQSDIPESLNSILENVTVDISTLEMPVIVTRDLKSMPLPKPAKKFNAENIKYRVQLSIQDQEFNFELDRKIAISNGTMTLSEVSDSQFGLMQDISEINYNSWDKIKRDIDQPPLNISVIKDKNQVNGSMLIKEQSSEIKLSFNGEFVFDGPPLDLFISSLEIDENQAVYFNILDVQTQKFNLFELRFIARKKINAFDAVHMTLRSLEGPEKTIHYWISDSENSFMIKKEFNIPEMGGGIMRINFLQLMD